MFTLINFLTGGYGPSVLKTRQQIQDALFPLINKDANTGDEKECNDFLLDCVNGAEKLLAECSKNN